MIAEHDGNIDNISMSRRSPDFTEMTIDLEVYDLKHLSAIIAQLRAKDVVARVERVNGYNSRSMASNKVIWIATSLHVQSQFVFLSRQNRLLTF